MISTDMLAAFVTVAKVGHLSRAALELAVSKSVVSKRIAQLELALGTTLFSRSTRHIALTAAGEAYLEHARAVLQELSTGEERLLALRSDLEGRIRVTAPVSWGQRILSRRLPEFLRIHPGLEIELVLSDRVMDLVAERMDVAFRWSSVHGQSTAFEHKVADIAWMLVGAPSYLSANGHPGTPDEAAGHALLGYWRDAADDWWELERRDERAQVRARSRYHVDNPEVVLEACLQGLGIALLPDYLCADALVDGRLVRVLPDWTPVTRFGTEIIALIMPDRARIRRHRVLVDFLVDRRSGAV